MRDKKAIFIGNSFIYWGGCVTFIKNHEIYEETRAAGGDKGYFNEICKANGINMDVYNYTYGGKNLNWIYENKISKLILRPRYDLYGRGAPLKRNESMVDIADEIIVIWDGKSKGSNYTVKYAEKKNKKLTIINLSDKKI